jgi:hypothetical protein
MKFNSQICTTREQSERLLALGLKKETADMVLVPSSRHDGSDVIRVRKSYLMEEDAIPAWSLHRLIEMMPESFEIEDKESNIWEYRFCMGKEDVSYEVYLYEKRFGENESIYDNIIDCIEWLIKKGYFNKEYLEEKK